MQTLEKTWAVQQWRESPGGQAIVDAGPALREDLLYVAKIQYRLQVRDWWPISPRLAVFVENALAVDAGIDAVSLACMVETGAASFNPKIADSDISPASDLLVVARTPREVEEFLNAVRFNANTKNTAKQMQASLLAEKVFIPRRCKAADLWWKIYGGE